jgi:ERCC4-related helicase
VIKNLSIHHVEFKDESDPEINKHTFTKVGVDTGDTGACKGVLSVC